MPSDDISSSALWASGRARGPLRITFALMAASACLVLAACGDDDKDGGSATPATAEQSAYPVTIRSKHGGATIAQRPARVVTLDNQATDDALARHRHPL